MDKCNGLPPSTALSSYLNFTIVEAVLLYKTIFENCKILKCVSFLKKCYVARILIGTKNRLVKLGLSDDIRQLSNESFSDDLNELNKYAFAIGMRLMSSKIKSKTRELGFKAKLLNDSKLKVKNMVPNEVYNCCKGQDKVCSSGINLARLSRPSSSSSSSLITSSSSITTPTLTSADGYLWIKANEYFKTKYYLLNDEQWENEFVSEENGTKSNDHTFSTSNDAGSSSHVAGSSSHVAVSSSNVDALSFHVSSNNARNSPTPINSPKMINSSICAETSNDSGVFHDFDDSTLTMIP